MSNNCLAVWQSTHEVGVDAVLLLESSACGGADPEVIDGLGVFPGGDGAREADDGLGCGRAMGDDGTCGVEEPLCSESEAGDGLAADDEGDARRSRAFDESGDGLAGASVLADGAELVEEDDGASRVRAECELADEREQP